MPPKPEPHLPLSLTVALPAGLVTFVVTFKTHPANEAGAIAAVVFLVLMFPTAVVKVLKAALKTADVLTKPAKKSETKKKS
ncbi:hypothetical protein [Streptomyces sp. NPDC097610]|uniref:hypothetical protein n=1 Tax=Streptomyces sp. NPDC097610 TaxID=3157227 RepID=UPI003325C861